MENLGADDDGVELLWLIFLMCRPRKFEILNGAWVTTDIFVSVSLAIFLMLTKIGPHDRWNCAFLTKEKALMPAAWDQAPATPARL
jgi:hypothetical protein